jgi:hypothetical protein
MVAGAESISQAAGRLALHADRPVRVLCSIVYDLRGGQISAPRIYLPISMLVEQNHQPTERGPYGNSLSPPLPSRHQRPT